MRLNRRRFTKCTAQAALAMSSFGVLGTAASKVADAAGLEEKSLLPIVDTHQHLWDLSKLRLPWLKSSAQLNRSFVTKDYLEATQGLNVVKAVYMEVAVDSSQLVDEAEHVVELCRCEDNPTVAAVIGGRPASEDFSEYISRFKDSPYVKGVRHILPGSKDGEGLWSQKEFLDGIRLLGELGMCFDLCMPPAQLPEAIELVDACRHTRFVLDHCGNADPKLFRPPGNRDAADRARAEQWRRDVGRLAERKHVICKISGIVAQASKESWTAADLAPVINHCLEVFGPDRVVFASDWPVCTRVATLRQWIEALEEVVRDRSETDRRKLLHDNAVRFYGLS